MKEEIAVDEHSEILDWLRSAFEELCRKMDSGSIASFYLVKKEALSMGVSEEDIRRTILRPENANKPSALKS